MILAKMTTCEICGSEDFEKHAGFLYCAVCQTQSQDYYEQEYEYGGHELNTVRRKKAQTSSKKTKTQKFFDDGMWTTWEAFNYILYGMTEEIKKCGVPKDFEKMVFKLWAAYLKECQAAFISKHQEKIPKLGLNFKLRDVRLLYNVDLPSSTFKDRKTRSKSYDSKPSSTSNSMISSQSKRSIALHRRKIIATDYQDILSSSMQESNYLADETLESLGRSTDGELTNESSDDSASLISSFRMMLTKKDYKIYKSSCESKRLLMSAKAKCKRDVKCPGKNKLLSIIHLALLMTGSQIQLSDLLRFIREGHLSYAKVTHFFPKHIKLPKNDFCYIEVTSDSLMPTHLHQRKITNHMAILLKIDKIPSADMHLLIDRYCEDLNLPKQVTKLAKKVLIDCVPGTTVPKSKTPLPSYEAWAMASIVFVMKLLLGLNDRTEIFLSQLAREINSLRIGDQLMFVFEDWQKYIECRKTILSDHHYPTLEQLSETSFRSSGKFLHTMVKESKDEHRNERFIPYSKYFMEKKLLDGVKEALNALSKSQDLPFSEFQPSLTPQISHTETIMRDLRQGIGVVEKSAHQLSKFPDLLKQSFKNCNIEFAFDPKSYGNLLKDQNSSLLGKFDVDHKFLGNKFMRGNRADMNTITESSSNYWVLEYPNASSCQLSNFREEVFEKTPKNFQWLMTECARMLEMNVRDVYNELLNLEKKFGK